MTELNDHQKSAITEKLAVSVHKIWKYSDECMRERKWLYILHQRDWKKDTLSLKGSFPVASLFLRDAIACASDWIRVAHDSKPRRFVAEILSDSTARDQLIARRD